MKCKPCMLEKQPRKTFAATWIAVLLTVCAFTSTQAVPSVRTTYTTIANGNWSSPGTWSGGNVPDEYLGGDVVHIYHDVVWDINHDLEIEDGTLNVYGILTIADKNIKMEEPTGTVNILGGLIIIQDDDFKVKKGTVNFSAGAVQICDGSYTDEGVGGTNGTGYIFDLKGKIEDKKPGNFSTGIAWCVVDGDGKNLPTSENCSAAQPPGGCMDTSYYQSFTSDISGMVRNDVDFDGDLSDADIGLSDVTVKLYTDPNGDGDESDGSLHSTITTNANGEFQFTNVDSETFVLVEVDPPGYTSTGDSDAPNDNRIAVNLTGGGDSSGNIFLDTNGAVLGGHVWVDLNVNGIQNQGEPFVSNVTVRLLTTNDALLQTATTSGTGQYAFNVTAGNYQVEFIPPSGYNLTQQNQGTDDTIDSDPNHQSGKTPTIGMVAGQIDYTTDAGLESVSGIDDYGDAPQSYSTLLIDDGARHEVVRSFHLGPSNGADSNGQPGSEATDDFSDDGVTFSQFNADGDPSGSICTTDYQIVVNASAAGMLDAWLDFYKDGTFDGGSEQIYNTQPLVKGDNILYFDIPCDAVVGVTYVRYRFSALGGLDPIGRNGNGEVEDYLFVIEGTAAADDFGDAPASYGTMLAANGARHQIIPGFQLGSENDADSNGQPDASAEGDDNDGSNDDDGVTFSNTNSNGKAQAAVCTDDYQISVNASAIGMLDAWLDIDGDGTFGEGVERIFNAQALIAGDNALTFDVPCASVTGTSFMRFRFSIAGGLSPTGSVNNGEVEDYIFMINGNDTQNDYGDAPASYGTRASDDGARHEMVEGFSLGAAIDIDSDGQPNDGATGDDDNDVNDEDGVTFSQFTSGGDPVGFLCSSGYELTVNASTPGRLDAWLDFNGNGTFGSGDQIFTAEALVKGDNFLDFDIPCTAVPDTSYVRFRFSSTGGLNATGAAGNGEVEDYLFILKGIDFGDAPDPDYPTLLASNGARHVFTLSGPRLGNLIDNDLDGQQSADGQGDDNNGADDEDGVQVSSLGAGTEASAQVTGTAGSRLDAWLDFNADGDWNDSGEKIANSLVLSGSADVITFQVPSNAPAGVRYARFRVSSAGGLSPTGLATDGEVEDYAVDLVGLVLMADAVYPQPVIADIEFDNGNMILGVMDRWGHQVGPDSHTPPHASNPVPGAEGIIASPFSAGDVLRACANGNSWIIEEGVDPANTGCGTAGVSQNVGGTLSLDEFYFQDDYQATNKRFAETNLGGALHIQGRSDMVTAAYTPLRPIDNELDQGGLVWTNSTAGGFSKSYRVYDELDLGSFGMASGLGDVIGYCPVAPIEFGNRVWLDQSSGLEDADLNGVQDPGELPLPGIALELVCNGLGGELTAGTLTDTGGNYTFKDNYEDVASWPGGLIPRNTTCEIRIDLEQDVLEEYVPTLEDARAAFKTQNEDLRDSDGIFDLPSGNFGVLINTGSSGQNNNSYDIGFITFALVCGSAQYKTAYGITAACEYDWGDAPDSYGTDKRNENNEGVGPSHAMDRDFVLGTLVDSEFNGVPVDTGDPADGDNNSKIDDEDGVVFSSSGLIACETNTITVNYTNRLGLSPLLDAWVDLNVDGDFNDAGEQVATSQNLSIDNRIEMAVPCTVGSDTTTVTYARFRLSSTGSLTPNGSAGIGEVEDYAVPLLHLDFGDAPDNYGTRIGNNGARHLVRTDAPSLGNPPRADNGTQSNDGASADAEEDGVVLPLNLPTAGQTYCMNITTGLTGGILDAWVDFNANGTFDHPSEHLAAFVSNGVDLNAPLPNESTTEVCIVPPDETALSVAYLRFRISSEGELNPTGLALDGEVEDYAVGASAQADLVQLRADVVQEQNIMLIWTIQGNGNNAGFEIEMQRSNPDESGQAADKTEAWHALDFVNQVGTSDASSEYTYTVTGLEPGRYRFRLKMMHYNGSYSYSPVVESRAGIPGTFLLEPAYPNPFNPATTIRFAVKEAQQVQMVIYDLMGREIKVLYDGRPEPGQLQTVRIEGSELSSGTYVVFLRGASFTANQKITLVK